VDDTFQTSRRARGAARAGRKETNAMKILQPSEWNRPRGFSHGMVTNGPGRWIVLAGQTGPGADGAYDPDLAVQVRHALTRIVRLLKEDGAGPEHVVRLNWYVVDRDAYEKSGAGIGAAWKDTLGKSFPTSTLLYVSGLVDRRALVELEATAFVPA
jgi:enamine deaminase RidA (YjgF/YER057c/UK114 family)